MAKRKVKNKPGEKFTKSKKRNSVVEAETPSTSFVTFKLPPEKLGLWPVTPSETVPFSKGSVEELEDGVVDSNAQDAVKDDQISLPDPEPAEPTAIGDESADSSGEQAPKSPEPQSPAGPETANDQPAPSEAEPEAPRNGNNGAAGKPSEPKSRTLIPAKPRLLHTPAHRQPRKAKSILKPEPSSGIRKATGATAKKKSKAVVLDPEPEIQVIDESPVSRRSNEENEPPSPSPDNEPVTDSNSDDGDDENDEMSDASASEKPKRPGLKLSFSRKPSTQAGGIQTAPAQTPGPQSAIARTPTIKLKIHGASTPAPTPGDAPKSKKKKEADTIDVTPGSKKKRKRESVAGGKDDEGNRPAPAPPGGKPPAVRKITFKPTPQTALAAAAAPKSTGTAQLLFKVKGKVPKRALGVGYDSELESEYLNDKEETVVGRELDPVIHEGFVLRMQPGDDCDYLRKSIEDGKVGEIFSKGGAAINLRTLDSFGRRGILQIKDHKYATSLVDLPCIIEGMKSWDKKGWVKSIDICQMLLVLGRCNSEEEARNYPLPEDVDPKTYQYAHGLTAPMKWVRKRRFARTKRARVDDIEAVERRVHALLEADDAAVSTKYHLLDHDPRLDEHGYSTEMEDDEDDDAEGEVDNYFDFQPNGHGALETPMLTETPVQELNQEDVDALERMFFDEDKVPATESTTEAQSTLHPPEVVGDSSFAVTSTSATPSATAAPTPISAGAAEATSDEDEDDDAGEEDEDRDDAEKEGDESKRQAMERIEDMQNKIAEQRDLLKKTTNAILKKKLARRIQDLEDDVAMMRKNAGLGGDDDE